MSIIERAREAAQTRRALDFTQRTARLLKAAERILDAKAPEDHAFDESPTDGLTLEFPDEGLSFRLREDRDRGGVVLQAYAKGGNTGTGWSWFDVRCLADLGELDFGAKPHEEAV